MHTAAELIDAFCDQVWLQDGLAASSLESYRRDLVAWSAWLAKYPGKELLAAERTDIEAFLAAQFRAKAKATSINRRLSTLRRFYRLHLQQGSAKADPTLRVQAPKLPRRLPKNLSEAQVEALLGLGCVAGQGFLFAEAGSLESLFGSEFVARRNELWTAQAGHEGLSPSGRYAALKEISGVA